jgi:ribosomal protein S27AE
LLNAVIQYIWISGLSGQGGVNLKQGKCTKCGSEEIYAGVEVLPKSGPFGSNSIPISIVSIAALDNYVCAKCGYLEQYIADPEKLKEISKKWPKAGKVEHEET